MCLCVCGGGVGGLRGDVGAETHDCILEIAGPTERQTNTPTDNLELPIHLTCMSLDYGRKQEYPVKENPHAASTQKGTRWESNPQPSHFEATVLTTIIALLFIYFN